LDNERKFDPVILSDNKRTFYICQNTLNI